MSQKILIWDVPTRVFHWLLVGSFAGAYYTADSERYRDIHVMLGYVLLGLLVFRFIWGFVGTRYAQFRSFWFSPREIFGYLKSLFKPNHKEYLGHNPAGSLAIWLLLSLGTLSGLSGVMALHDIGGDVVVEWHDVVSELMLVVVGVHVLGVIVSSVMQRENLVRAMITGYKVGTEGEGISTPYFWLALELLGVAAVFLLGYLVG